MGMNFWRCFTHWIGGMGVLVFVMTILPLSPKNSMFLMKAEMPGPTCDKLVPKARSTRGSSMACIWGYRFWRFSSCWPAA